MTAREFRGILPQSVIIEGTKLSLRGGVVEEDDRFLYAVYVTDEIHPCAAVLYSDKCLPVWDVGKVAKSLEGLCLSPYCPTVF